MHYEQGLYLAMVDCGPSRFVIWRELRAENAEEIAGILNEVFLKGVRSMRCLWTTVPFFGQRFEDHARQVERQALF